MLYNQQSILKFIFYLFVVCVHLRACFLFSSALFFSGDAVKALKPKQLPCVIAFEIQLKGPEEVSRQVTLKSFFGGDICFPFRVPITPCVFRHYPIFNCLERLLPTHTNLVPGHKHRPLPKLQPQPENTAIPSALCSSCGVSLGLAFLICSLFVSFCLSECQEKQRECCFCCYSCSLEPWCGRKPKIHYSHFLL